MTKLTEPVLSTVQIADDLNVEKETIQNWIKRDLLKAYKPGRDWVVLLTDYEEFKLMPRPTRK